MILTLVGSKQSINGNFIHSLEPIKALHIQSYDWKSLVHWFKESLVVALFTIFEIYTKI